MSEMYSSASGSYQSYLSQRSADQITKTIKEENFKQNMMNFMYTGVLTRTTAEVGNKVDRMNANIQRMSTGIQTSINQNTYAVAASSILLANTFNEGFNKLNNTLDLGFAGVQSSIGAMSAAMSAGFDRFQQSIDKWGTKICEKLDAIHDIVNNPLLTASRELSRRAQTNAQKQFYEEALEDIKGAVEKNKTDYISWGLMGKIYLFGMSEFSNVVDVPKALEAFTNACKYITPDIDESDEAKNMAAEFYFYKAFAEYVLFNESKIAGNADTALLESSIRDNTKSFTLSDKMYESVYNKAKALALLGKNEEAFEEIKKAIKIDGLYSIKILNDPDLQSLTSQIESFLNEEKQQYLNKIQETLPIFDNYVFCKDSEFAQSTKTELDKIKELTEDIPYLDMRYGFEFLNNLKFMIENNDLLLIDRKVTDVNLKRESGHHKMIRYALDGEIGFLDTWYLNRVLKYTYNNLFTGQITKRDGDVSDSLSTLYTPSRSEELFEIFKSEDYKHGALKEIDQNIWRNIRNNFETYCNSNGLEFNYVNFRNWIFIDLNSNDYEEISIILDKNTILKLQSQGQANIYQTGIVQKKDFEVGQQEKQRETEKHIEELRLYREQQKKIQEELNSDTYSLVISGINGKGITDLYLGAYKQSDNNKKDLFVIPITVDKNYTIEDIECWINHESVISAVPGKVIQLRKDEFDRQTVTSHEGHGVEKTYVRQCYRKNIPITEALSLGICKENVELRKQRKAAKTRKRVIIAAVIIAIIAVIGIIVF